MTTTKRRTGTAKDPLIGVLDKIAVAADETARDVKELGTQVCGARRERASGATAMQMFSGRHGRRIVALVDRMAARLASVGGSSRRAIVRILAGEGSTVASIARAFGVSHQRISSILGKER